jgi:hypothetical protein
MLPGRSKKIRARRVELDYVAPVRRPRWLGLGMLALSLAVAGQLAFMYRESQVELARLEAAANLASPERRPVRAIPRERLDDETKSAEAVVRELTLPWAPLLRSLEEAAMRDVAILQLQPDAHLRLVKLTAEARTQEAMFAYLRRLAAAKNLGEAHLVSHQVQRDDPQRPIHFSVQAALR